MPDRTYLKSNIHMYGVPSTSPHKFLPIVSVTVTVDKQSLGILLSTCMSGTPRTFPGRVDSTVFDDVTVTDISSGTGSHGKLTHAVV